MPKPIEPPTTAEAAEPKTPAEIVSELPAGTQHVFVLLKQGLGTPIVAAGKTYEAMWEHAEQVLRTPKQDLLKHGYQFDHISTVEAERLLTE